MSAGPSFQCPHCGTNFPYNATLLGKRVKCPVCQKAFVVQGSQAEQAVNAPVDDAGASVSASTAAAEPPAANSAEGISINIDDKPIAAAYGSARGRRATVSQLFWALLDFRLEKYLTPYIIRLYWILAIVVALLYVLGIVLALVLEGPASVTQAADPSQEALRQLLGQPPQATERSDLLVAYNRFKSFVTRAIFIVSVVLAIRVWCELIIVVFNIANLLKSIDHRVSELAERRE
jgi:Domain of unknown function (DUF4282)